PAEQWMVAGLVERHPPEIMSIRAGVETEARPGGVQIRLPLGRELLRPLVEELERPTSMGDINGPPDEHRGECDRGHHPRNDLGPPRAEVETPLDAADPNGRKRERSDRTERDRT